MAVRMVVYRLSDDGLAVCVETTDQRGAIVRKRWMGYLGDGSEAHAMDGAPADLIEPPLREVDITPDDASVSTKPPSWQVRSW